jgi:hypothetical protein
MRTFLFTSRKGRYILRRMRSIALMLIVFVGSSFSQLATKAKSFPAFKFAELGEAPSGTWEGELRRFADAARGYGNRRTGRAAPELNLLFSCENHAFHLAVVHVRVQEEARYLALVVASEHEVHPAFPCGENIPVSGGERRLECRAGLKREAVALPSYTVISVKLVAVVCAQVVRQLLG